MQDNVLNLIMNPWTITIIGGLVVVFISFLFKKSSDSNKLVQTSKTKNENNQKQNVVVNLYDRNKTAEILRPEHQNKTIDVRVLKVKTKILFIDDIEFKKIDNLKKAGWNVTRIKDVDNLDNEDIRSADIIFIDYKGVGTKLSKDQGIGLVKALRNRYKNEKWLILYSAHDLPLSIYDAGADSYLAKNSQVYEMEEKIIEGSSHIPNDFL